MVIESIRQSYKPARVRLLLVGESPPAGGKFFYVKGAMTTYTRRAFEQAHGVTFTDNVDFLRHFQACGCYLDDLCHDPVYKLPRPQREARLIASIEGLAQRMRDMNPVVVAVVLRKIESHVHAAVTIAGINPEIIETLPFAGNSHQNKYVEALAGIVRSYVPAAHPL